MKEKIFITAIIFIFAMLTTNSNAQTTVEEYNYVVKGYKVQTESGLDMKKGYELKYVDETTVGERSVTLQKLVKTSESKTVAYMVIYKKKGNPNEYICIPHPNSSKEIIQAYWDALYNGVTDSSNRLQIITFMLTTSLKW